MTVHLLTYEVRGIALLNEYRMTCGVSSEQFVADWVFESSIGDLFLVLKELYISIVMGKHTRSDRKAQTP